MPTLRVLGALACVMLLTACSSQEFFASILEKAAPKELQDLSNNIGDVLLERDGDALKAYLPEELSAAEGYTEQLASVFKEIPEGELLSRELVSAQANTVSPTSGSQYTRYQLVYQYHMTGGWMVLSLNMLEQDDATAVTNLNVTRVKGDLRELNALNLSKAGAVQWFVLIGVILLPAFVLFTFVKAFRMRKTLLRPKRWLFFILFGLGALSFNWTTLQAGFSAFHLGLLSVSAIKGGPIAPWIFTLYFPMGATLFWVNLKTNRLKLKPLPQGVDKSSPPE